VVVEQRPENGQNRFVPLPASVVKMVEVEMKNIK
jgi:hypothetical protein